jgi:NADH-quinone oxidoreductase subunit H
MTYSFNWNWLTTVILIGVVMGALQGTCAYLILIERKVAAYVQDRLGPNRVGPWGLLQPIADGIKFILKEEIIPGHVDKLFYMIAPAVALSTTLMAFAVVPFGPTSAPPVRNWPQTTEEEANATEVTFTREIENYNQKVQFVIAPRVDIGILYVFAVSSLAAYGVILGGWSSNNKYSILGGLRSSAQLISYEIPMGMSVLGVIMLAGSLNNEQIIDHQVTHGWNVLYQPLACLLFLICILAECNRLPFDLAEAEQELVGGYHTEYSGMKFALFFLAEYTHMITTSFLLVVLFLGGWHFPWVPESGTAATILQVLVFAVKMMALIIFYMLIRWTIPRFRFDQLMGLAWKVLIPLALVNLVCVMVVKHIGWDDSPWLLTVASIVLFAAAGWMTLYQKKSRTREQVSREPHAPVALAR